MLLEHLIYSTALAMIAGMLHYRYRGMDYSWIIIASAFAPDIDLIAGWGFRQLGMNVLIFGNPIKHGDFHNIAALLIFSVFVGLLLKSSGMKFMDSAIFAGIGFGAHIFEDALIANPAYSFFWPLSAKKYGIGIIEYKADWYCIANTDVLITGVILLMLCAGIRVAYEGNGGMKKTARVYGVVFIIFILMIPAISHRDYFMEKKFIDKLQYTQDVSLDSVVFHSGSHSARIEIPGNESKRSGIWKSDLIPIKPDTAYIFSSWGRTQCAGGNKPPAVKVVEIDVNKKWITQTNLVFSKGTNDWTCKQITIKTHINTSQVFVYANIWEGYGTFWFDDVELYEEGTDNNLIHNSGFEEDFDHQILKFER